MSKDQSAAKRGRRGPPKFKVCQHAHPLVKFLFDRVSEQSIDMLELSTKSGVSYATIRYWITASEHRKTSAPSIENLEACLNVVGYTLFTPQKVPNVEK